MSWLDATFGVIYAEGEELELLGGINFVGFEVTEDAENNRHNIEVDASALNFDASDVGNDSVNVTGAHVADALDTLYAAIQAVDGSDVPNSRTITAGANISGGGTLAADRTFDLDAALTAMTSIAFGTAASAGHLRGPTDFAFYARSASAANLPMVRNVSDVLILGGGTEGWTGAYLETTTGSCKLKVGAADKWVTTSTTHDAKTMPIQNVAYVEFGATASVAASGLIRVAIGDDGAPVTIMSGLRADAGATIPLMRWGTFGDNILAIGTTTDLASIYIRALNAVLVTIGSGTSTAFNEVSSQANIATTRLNSATIAAPVEGAQITTTATINVGQGNNRTVTAAGGAYTITLGTTGSPYTGEVISLICSNALANAVTVANGGGGGGSIGIDLGGGSGLPSGAKIVADFRYDGTNWVFAGAKRLA